MRVSRIIEALAMLVVLCSGGGLGGGAPSGPEPAFRRRILSEIDDLQGKRRVDSELYQRQTREIAEARSAAQTAQARLDQACAFHGRASVAAALASQELDRARRRLWAGISAREHARYRLNLLDQAIQQRRLSLSYQEGPQEQSLWR